MRKRLIFLVCAFALSASAQMPPSDLAALDHEAVKAYQAKDWATFLAIERKALAVSGNPRRLYNVACGESLQGNSKEAVRILKSLADSRLDLGAEMDGDFDGIKSSPDWKEFVARLSELRKPLVASDLAFSTTEKGLLSAGIAFDAKTGDTFIGSVRKRKILRRAKDGTFSDFIGEAQDGILAVDSLAVDETRHLLWASTAAVPHMQGYLQTDAGRSGLFAFDLVSHKLKARSFLPVDGKPHFLNAIALDRDGNVYVSDSGTPLIFELKKGSLSLEIFIPEGVFQSTQGLAFSEDQKTLFVADYTDGLWAVDVATRKRERLTDPPDAWLFGLDGIARTSDGFVAVQIGVRPQRVIRLHLDAAGRRVLRTDVVEMNHPDYDEPIQGITVGDSFLYIANSQLSIFDVKTNVFTKERAKPTVILRLPLKK